MKCGILGGENVLVRVSPIILAAVYGLGIIFKSGVVVGGGMNGLVI